MFTYYKVYLLAKKFMHCGMVRLIVGSVLAIFLMIIDSNVISISYAKVSSIPYAKTAIYTSWGQHSSMPEVFGIVQTDLDRDGDPDLTVVSCSFASSTDQVTVVDYDDDMIWSEDWAESTDFDGDSWIFDAHGDGTAELIVVFGKRGDRVVADFYDDRDGDGQVAFRLTGVNLQILESKHWTMRVDAPGGWLNAGGALNTNLSFALDGPSPSIWFWSESLQARLLRTDGKLDWHCNVVDADSDGAPESEVCRCLVPQDFSQLVRSWVKVNTANVRSLPLPASVFWPFLGSVDALPKHNYFDFMPSIIVDWSKAMIVQYGVTGYPIETGFHIQSTEGMVAGEISNANFENPQAYYDLAKDADNRPELHIRMHVVNPGDWLEAGVMNTFLHEIRYSWNQRNTPDLSWDYKVGLAGRQVIDTEISIQDYRLRTVPYEQLPAWVTVNSWDYATFVAREGYPGQSSEGIYAWAPVYAANLYNSHPLLPGNQIYEEEALRVFPLHYTGLSDQPLAPFFHDIHPGLRGEYNFDLSGPVRLYFSPIDRRLHLLGAQKGIWSLADGHGRIEYENIDQDGYIDQWTYWFDGQLEGSLAVGDGCLLLGDNNELVLLRADIPKALFVASPPCDHEEWVALGLQLESHGAASAPTSFETMVAQFAEPVTRIEGASFRSFRPTQAGFRFVLSLSPGFRITEGEDWLGIGGLEPSEYVVIYDGTFHVQPLTPTYLVLVSDLGIDAKVTALHPVHLSVLLQNQGLDDAQDVSLYLHAGKVGEPSGVVEELWVTLLAGGEASRVSCWWIPETAGLWELWLSVDDQMLGRPGEMDRFMVEVEAAPQTGLWWVWQRLGVVGSAWALLALGLGLAMMAFTTFLATLRSFREGK